MVRNVKSILFVGVGVLAFVVSGAIIFAPQAPQEEGALISEPQGVSSLELGQFYFNHDDDPYGVYDTNKAKEFFIKAIDEEPENPLPLYQLGRIQFIEGNFEESLATFARLEERFEDRIPNLYYMLGLVYGYKARMEGDEESWQKAEDAFTTFVRYAKESPWPRVDLAWVYFAQGKFADMLPTLEEGLSYNPDNPWLLNMYGLALLNTERKAEAKEVFDKALRESEKLSEIDWGRSYPGNDPALWGSGLSEFQALIRHNSELAAQGE